MDAAKHPSMPTPRISVQLGQISYELRPQRVEMDVAHELPEIRVLIADDGLVAILEHMPIRTVRAIVAHGIAREQPPHERRQPLGAAPHEEMGMIWQQGPRVDGRAGRAGNLSQPLHEVLPILTVRDDPTLLSPADDCMVQHPGSVQPRLPGHPHDEVRFASRLAPKDTLGKQIGQLSGPGLPIVGPVLAGGEGGSYGSGEAYRLGGFAGPGRRVGGSEPPGRLRTAETKLTSSRGRIGFWT